MKVNFDLFFLLCLNCQTWLSKSKLYKVPATRQVTRALGRSVAWEKLYFLQNMVPYGYNL
jgi:hypothetical protein